MQSRLADSPRRTARPVEKPRVGVLCYNLNPATSEFLNRLQATGAVQVKAYPLVNTKLFLEPLFEYRPTSFRGHFVTLNNAAGTAPDTHVATLGVGPVRALVTESDAVLLLGLQALPGLIATWFARRRRLPVIAATQCMAPENERNRAWIVRALKSWLLRRSSVHVAQTPPSIETLRQVYGIDAASILYAPFDAGAVCFRDLLTRASARSADLETSLTAGGDPIFLYVGSMNIRLKGLDVLLDALALLSERLPNARLLMVGEPTSAVEPEVIRRGLEGRVALVGGRTLEELPGYYLAADVLVLPTRRDMWPKVIVEAALAGMPVVTTDRCGAAGHLVKDGYNGFVVRAGDPESLARAMDSCTDPERRREMGVRSKHLVESFVDPEKEVSGFVEAIHSVLSTNGRF